MTSFVDHSEGAMAKHILGTVFIFPDNIHCMRRQRRSSDVLVGSFLFTCSSSSSDNHSHTHGHTRALTHRQSWLGVLLLGEGVVGFLFSCCFRWLFLLVAIAVENQFFRITYSRRQGFCEFYKGCCSVASCFPTSTCSKQFSTTHTHTHTPAFAYIFLL